MTSATQHVVLDVVSDLAFFGLMVPYAALAVLRAFLARGTRQRHAVARGAAWARPFVRPGTALYSGSSIADLLLSPDVPMWLRALGLVIHAVVARVWWNLPDDDDEDPWGDLGRKVKRAFLRVAAGPQPVGAGA